MYSKTELEELKKYRQYDKNCFRGKEHVVMIKGSISQGDITLINVCACDCNSAVHKGKEKAELKRYKTTQQVLETLTLQFQ